MESDAFATWSKCETPRKVCDILDVYNSHFISDIFSYYYFVIVDL